MCPNAKTTPAQADVISNNSHRFNLFTRQARQDSNLQPPVLEFSPVFCVWLDLATFLEKNTVTFCV